MKLSGRKFEEAFDETVSRIREDAPGTARAEEAAQRVWKNLVAEMKSAEPADLGGRISGCGDIQALLPAYRIGKLSAARELLVQDHLKECVACRNELHSPGARKSVILPWRDTPALNTTRAGSFQIRKFAIAAGMVLGIGLSAYLLRDQFLAAPAGSRAALSSSDGPVYLVSAKGQRLAKQGDEFGEQEWVRVPHGSHAFVKLRDGSMIEMNERSEMTVSMTRKDTAVHLERGAIIVQAAKRRTGHLLVLTDDAKVSVTGTVFSVNRGTKGNRVSVVEGEVVVEQSGRTNVLHSGDQVTSSSKVERVSVRDEIGWSRNLDQHIALLNEFAGLARKIQAIQLPGLRYQTPLLSLLPETTVVYVSIPNYADALSQANRLLQDRVRQSAVLREWWQKGGEDKQESINQMVDTIRQLSDYIGDEIVLSVTRTGPNTRPEFVILSEVKKPGLGEFVHSKMKEIGMKEIPKDLTISIGQHLLCISPNGEMAASLVTGAPTQFASTAFGKRIAETYTDGAGIVFAANVAAMRPPVDALVTRTGAADMQYVVLERREINHKTENKATVNFSGPRQGVASWLAAPAPIGSLDFVSPGASVAAGFVVKNPALVADDIFALIATAQPKFLDCLRDFESKTGVRVRDDIAASLGTDVTVSIDGPMLPLPAWKIIAEVTDTARLQQSLERLIQEYQNLASANGEKGVSVETNEINGRKVYILKGVEHPLELRYAFSDGYLILTQDPGAMRRAFRAKDDNFRLVNSHRFRMLLPTDREPNFSAVIFYDLGGAAKGLADLAGEAHLNEDQRRNVDELLRNVEPSLIYAYGSGDKVQLGTTSGFFGLTIEQILGSAGISDVVRMAQSGTKRR